MVVVLGLDLLEKEECNFLYILLYGIGELIKDVLNYGVKIIILGIGGSVINDGGIGMLSVLGV